MLAIVDRDGIVRASIPGLANLAGLTIPEVEAGLEVLSNPDPYSRTKEHEGRRIEEAEGGWLILNYEKLRDMCIRSERKEYQAAWARQKRRRLSNKEGPASVGKEITQALPQDPCASLWNGFQEVWNAYPKKTARKAAEQAWGMLNVSPDFTKQVLEAIEQQKTWASWQETKYIPDLDKWLAGGRWEDEEPKGGNEDGFDYLDKMKKGLA